MEKIRSICGRDVHISINGNPLFQAESAEVRQVSEIHKVRSCFFSNDIAHIRGKSEYKAILINLRFLKPFENCNFHDLDNFTAILEFDSLKITLSGCMWNDFAFTADKEKFREHISFTAFDMNVEEIADEGN